MNVFKRILVVFSLCFYLFFSYNNQRVYAATGIEEALAIGASLEVSSGGSLTPFVVGALVTGGILYGGYQLLSSDYVTDMKNYIITKIGIEALKGMIYLAQDDSGNEYAALTDSGLNSIQSVCNTAKTSDIPVSTNKTTSNTASDTIQPFMYNDFYMKPNTLTSSPHVIDNIILGAGDTINFCIYSNGAVYTTSYTAPTNAKRYIQLQQVFTTRVYAFTNSTASFPSSGLVGLTWVGATDCVKPATNYYIGYKTVSNTVYVPSDAVISGTGIDGNASDKLSGSAVAVPISAQYGTGSATYGAATGATATAVSGLTAQSNTGSTTGEATTEGSYWEQLWDWLTSILSGIRAIPSSLEQWFTVDWNKVKLHINYIDIVKSHFQPIFDLYNLFANLSFDKVDSSGKFYMKIPHEMGGDDQEHCVLDLTVGAVYITTARDFIKYGLWIFFAWYIFKRFDPKFSI